MDAPTPNPATSVRRLSRSQTLFAPELLRAALRRSFVMLRPDIQWKNPVMFVVEVGTVLTILNTLAALAGERGRAPVPYLLALDAWLLLTLLFANFASALAEARGKAHADALRQTRHETPARRLLDDGRIETTVSTALRAGDRVVVEAGEFIPGDGEIVEGVASVDESSITGESAPVIREAGGDRSGVTGGTRVLSDRIVVQVTAEHGQSFLDRMIALVEGAIRQRTPNEIALALLLSALTSSS
jgi:K+-transporting ATPase ATPase B chain